ncbi:MAG: hypothetical protein OEZ34_11610 [Spirochaetia bacterium]|nr:hypothetical protein [Spirochaetia bacterium]
MATIVTYIFFYLLKHNTWTHYVFNPDEKKIYKYKMRFGKEKYKFLEDYDKVFSLIIESHYFTEMRLNKYSTGPTHKFPAEWRYTAILLFNNGKYLELNQSTKDHSTDETVHEWTHNDVRLLEDELSCLSDIVKIPYHKTPFRLQWGIKNKPIETIDDLKFMNSEEARHYFPSRKSKYIFYGSIGLCILLLLLGLIYYEEIANYFYSFNSYSSSDLYLDYLIIKNRFDMFIIEADYYIHSFLRDVRYIFEDFLGEYDLD